LYEPSDIFTKRRTFAQKYGDHWGILSGKYGYLRPWDTTPYYEMHRKERTGVWAAFVLEDLIPDLQYWDTDIVTILAGRKYVSPLRSELESRGFEICDYNEGLRPGERKASLKQANKPGKQATLSQSSTDG
jgi:hypothetical protein